MNSLIGFALNPFKGLSKGYPRTRVDIYTSLQTHTTGLKIIKWFTSHSFCHFQLSLPHCLKNSVSCKCRYSSSLAIPELTGKLNGLCRPLYFNFPQGLFYICIQTSIDQLLGLVLRLMAYG